MSSFANHISSERGLFLNTSKGYNCVKLIKYETCAICLGVILYILRVFNSTIKESHLFFKKMLLDLYCIFGKVQTDFKCTVV